MQLGKLITHTVNAGPTRWVLDDQVAVAFKPNDMGPYSQELDDHSNGLCLTTQSVFVSEIKGVNTAFLKTLRGSECSQTILAIPA